MEGSLLLLLGAKEQNQGALEKQPEPSLLPLGLPSHSFSCA